MSSQQNMELTLTGHPIRSQHLMALSYGRVFVPHGRIFHPIHVLKWEMGQPSSFGRKDTWLGNSPLKETFPNIFLIAANEDSSIPHNRENNTWKPLLRRHLQDWEVEDLMTLLDSLENFTVNNHNAERSYSIKAMHLVLQ